MIVDYVWAPQKRNNIITYGNIEFKLLICILGKQNQLKEKKKGSFNLNIIYDID